jgi:glycosyltransferase involved in cell wall biosynthesis
MSSRIERVAVVGSIYPQRGGIAHYTAFLANRLSRQYDVRVYAFHQLYPAWLFPGRSQRDPGAAPELAAEIRNWLIPWWPPTWARVYSDWAAWRPQVVVIQWWVTFLAPMTAWLTSRARQLDAEGVLICHNVLPHEPRLWDPALVTLALGSAGRLIVHSASEQARARQLLTKLPVIVIPLPSYGGLSSEAWTRERARATFGGQGHLILFFGLVRPYKGLLDLLEALPSVRAECRDVTLWVVGEIWGSDKEYRQKVERLGLRDCVHFVDRYVSNDEAAMYFAAADLVALPYRHATGSAVLQLALGSGVPVVATRTGGMAESVSDGETGFLVEPGDVAGLSLAIRRFFRENCGPAFRQAIAGRAECFDWDRMVDAITASVG